VTLQEKYIYNCYLETSRKLNDKPFRYRKDFDGFEDKEEYVYINKLGSLFKKFPNLNVKDFFEAPFFVYSEKYFDLKFYTTQRAIKAYTIYQSKFLLDVPDHEQVIEKIKDSYKFIYNFCKDNSIKIEKYTEFKSKENKIHDFLIHLKDRKVSLYCLFTFPNFDKILREYDADTKNFLFGDTLQNLNFYRTKYYSSSRAKKLCTMIYEGLISKQTI